MKFPALVIALFAAAGILAAAPLAVRLPHALLFFLALALGFLLCGCALLKLGRLNLAWLTSLAAWFFLSAAAAQCALLDRPPDLVSQLVETGRLDLSEPLRWRGTLSADPLRLPWGLRYDLDLEQVQTAGTWIGSHGGMRVSYFYEGRAAHEPVPLRAGDRAELLVRARLVRNFGDPGSFDYRAFLARQGIHLTASLRSSELMQQLPSSTPRLRQRIARLRGRLLNDLDAMFSGSASRAAVARAMLLGDRNFLDRQQVESFQQTGAYHVLVVAGLHVGVLVVVLLWIGRKLRQGILARALVTIAVLVCYVGIVEDRPPILRAALMATLYLLGRMAYRRIDFLNATGVAALAILLVSPAEIRDASFQLSFLAVGIVGGISAPLLERTAERYRRALDHLGDVTRDGNHAPGVTEFRLDLRAAANWLGAHLPQRLANWTHEIVAFPLRMVIRIWELAVISLCIQFGMLPLMAAYFHRVSLAAPLANIPAVLLTGIIVPFGFAALSIHAIWRGLGSALGYPLGFLIAALTGSVNWFARAHWVSFRVPSPPLLLTVAFLMAMVLLSAAILSKRRWASWTSCMAAIVLAGLIADYPFPPRLEGGRLEVTTLDVGQGDAIFLAFPDGRTMLVDGGGLPGSSYIRGVRPGIDVGEDVVSPYLWARGLKRIDVVVLTHAHQDHLGGLPAVLRNFRVGQLWVGRDVESAAYRALLDQAKSRGVPIIHRAKGDAFEWAGVRGRVLWPATDDTASAPSNNDSVVLRLEDGNDSLLLAGDIERPVERGILGEEASLASEFLKVPHHGSRTSTTQPFLDAVHPRFAAISVGEANAFGHPNREVIDRISAEGARLLRTDRDGAITVVTDGQRLEMRSFWGCRSAPCAENASSPEAVPYALGSRE